MVNVDSWVSGVINHRTYHTRIQKHSNSTSLGIEGTLFLGTSRQNSVNIGSIGYCLINSASSTRMKV